jgi:hypothetical protein
MNANEFKFKSNKGQTFGKVELSSSESKSNDSAEEPRVVE